MRDTLNKNYKKVYLLRNKNTNLLKVGISSNVKRRVRQLELSGGCKLDIVFISGDYHNASVIEKSFMEHFRSRRKEGEWFDIEQTQAKEVLEYIINNLSVIYRLDL